MTKDDLKALKIKNGYDLDKTSTMIDAYKEVPASLICLFIILKG